MSFTCDIYNPIWWKQSIRVFGLLKCGIFIQVVDVTLEPEIENSSCYGTQTYQYEFISSEEDLKQLTQGKGKLSSSQTQTYI